jgi:hypothetical protein
MPKMNPERKTQWVFALRSGNYKQGRGWLREDDRFCCLGVLCDLYDPTAWDEHVAYMLYFGEGCLPPYRVRQEVGLDIEDANDLANMNDRRGSSFEDIARYIEEHL